MLLSGGRAVQPCLTLTPGSVQAAGAASIHCLAPSESIFGATVLYSTILHFLCPDRISASSSCFKTFLNYLVVIQSFWTTFLAIKTYFWASKPINHRISSSWIDVDMQRHPWAGHHCVRVFWQFHQELSCKRNLSTAQTHIQRPAFSCLECQKYHPNHPNPLDCHRGHSVSASACQSTASWELREAENHCSVLRELQEMAAMVWAAGGQGTIPPQQLRESWSPLYINSKV